MKWGEPKRAARSGRVRAYDRSSKMLTGSHGYIATDSRHSYDSMSRANDGESDASSPSVRGAGRRQFKDINVSDGVGPAAASGLVGRDETKHVHELSQIASLSALPQIERNFEVESVLGSGTFSTVFKIKLKETQQRFALKHIVPTCKPRFIERELECLDNLGGQHHVSQLLGLVRHEDRVMLILNFCEHEEFLDYYTELSILQIQSYTKALLEAIDHVHTCGIVHRDVKPQNFLYHRRHNQFLLVDFGLAQLIEEDGVIADAQRPGASPAVRHTKNSSLGHAARIGPADADGGGAVRVGVGKFERRAGLDAMRAGTRGFRAPEVLLCVKDQSPAIDVWSVGAILITILSGRSPFFAASSDIDNLCEIGALFGMQRLCQTAGQLGKELLFATLRPVGHVINGEEMSMKPKGLDYDMPAFLKLVTTRLAPEHPAHRDAPDELYALLADLLELHPGDRPRASKALRHPFFQVCLTK